MISLLSVIDKSFVGITDAIFPIPNKVVFSVTFANTFIILVWFEPDVRDTDAHLIYGIPLKELFRVTDTRIASVIPNEVLLKGAHKVPNNI